MVTNTAALAVNAAYLRSIEGCGLSTVRGWVPTRELLTNPEALEDHYYVKPDRATSCLRTSLGAVAEMDASQTFRLEALPRNVYLTEGEKMSVHFAAYWADMLKYTAEMAVSHSHLLPVSSIGNNRLLTLAAAVRSDLQHLKALSKQDAYILTEYCASAKMDYWGRTVSFAQAAEGLHRFENSLRGDTGLLWWLLDEDPRRLDEAERRRIAYHSTLSIARGGLGIRNSAEVAEYALIGGTCDALNTPFVRHFNWAHHLQCRAVLEAPWSGRLTQQAQRTRVRGGSTMKGGTRSALARSTPPTCLATADNISGCRASPSRNAWE
jgi:hypothetical protein